MFENSGEKIVKVAKVLFWITVIASVILAFVLGWSKEYHSYYFGSGGYYSNEFHPVYFFSLLIGYPLVSYISTLFIIAFGELVQNSRRIKDATEEIKNMKLVDHVKTLSRP